MTYVDIEAVMRAVAARLEAPTAKGDDPRAPPWKDDDNRKWVRGRFRGRAVTVVCFNSQSGRSCTWWEVASEIDAPPTLLLEVREGAGSAQARGTGDPAFDAAWHIESAPASAAERIIDAPVRAAILRLGPELHPPLRAPFTEANVAALVTVDKGEVTVTCQGKYGEAAVLAGLEVAVLVVERVAALAEERKGAPLSAAQIADEEAQLASLRTKKGPLWNRLSLPLKVVLVIAAALLAVYGVLDEAGFLPRR